MEVKTSRPFRQRFLDGYDRHELREEVAKVKPRRLSGLRKKYASWALGGALAIGGIGIPLKVGKMLHETQTPAAAQRPPGEEPEKATTRQIASDLNAAQRITSEVSGGLASAAQDVAQTVAPTAIAEKVSAAPVKLTMMTNDVKRAFFQAKVPFGSII